MKEKIIGGLLGLIFVVFGLDYFFHYLPSPPLEEGSPFAMFVGAMYGTGYLGFVKVLELAGGILVAIPATRRLGMLILGPIVVNIFATNVFLVEGGWTQLPVMLVIAFAAFLLWSERKSFGALIKGAA